MSGVKSACVFVIWLAGWVMFIGTFLVLLFCLFLVSSVWSGCVIRRGGCIGDFFGFTFLPLFLSETFLPLFGV